MLHEKSLSASARLLLFLGAFFFLALPYAQAATISYEFLPNTEITLINEGVPYTETFTGSFSYDDVIGALSNIDVTMSGPYYNNTPVTFSYTVDQLGVGPNEFGLGTEGTNVASGDLVDLAFDLALGAPNDPLGGASAYNGPPGYNVFYEGGFVQGGIATVTPLPAALPLFATGLGGLSSLLGWRRKRKNTAAVAA